MKTLISIVLLIGLISSSFAQNAVKLAKDDPAPYSGVLITEEKVIELDKAKRQNIVLKDLRAVQEDLTDYHRADAKLQRKRLSEAKYDSYVNVLAAFLVGVVTTSVAMKINSEINK